MIDPESKEAEMFHDDRRAERATTKGDGMRIPTKIPAALVALILTALVGLSACGDLTVTLPPTPEPTPQPEPTSQPAPTPEPEPGPASNPQPNTSLPEKWTDEKVSGQAEGFKGCHGMKTKATLYSQTAKVYGSTDIWSHCEFGGFTGTSGVLLVNEDNTSIGAVMSPDSWGVNGKVEATLTGGRFERFGETWKAPVPDPEDLVLVHGIRAFNSHAPRQRLWDILNEGVAQGKKAVEVIGQIVALTG